MRKRARISRDLYTHRIRTPTAGYYDEPRRALSAEGPTAVKSYKQLRRGFFLFFSVSLFVSLYVCPQGPNGGSTTRYLTLNCVIFLLNNPD